MTDNIFEIETTALAHVACAPQDSGVLLTDFATAYLSVNHSRIFSVLEKTGFPGFLSLPAEYSKKSAPHKLNLWELNGDNSLWPEEYDKVVLRVVSFSQWPLNRSSDGSKNQLSPETTTNWNSCSLHNALTLLLHRLSESFKFALAPAFRSVDCIADLYLNCRKCCWVQHGSEGRESLSHCLPVN